MNDESDAAILCIHIVRRVRYAYNSCLTMCVDAQTNKRLWEKRIWASSLRLTPVQKLLLYFPITFTVPVEGRGAYARDWPVNEKENKK